VAIAGQRILVLSNFFSQGHGGTPESVLLLGRGLSALDVAVDVLCNEGLIRDIQMRNDLPATDDDFSHSIPDVGSYAALFIAGSWNRRAPVVAIRAALAGVPITYAAKGCLCDVEFERLRDMRRVPYFMLVEWFLLALSRRVIFSSQAEWDNSVLPRWVWRRKAALVPELFAGDAIIDSAPAPRDGITMGFMAEIAPRKGLHELIAGLGHYLGSNPGAPVRLKVAGAVRPGSETYFKECQALAHHNGTAAHIEWCKPARGSQRRDFYRSLDFFMCPSRFESFGLTPLEALWQGIPVCTSPGMGVLEYLQPEAPVLRLTALSKEKIADAIAGFADNLEGWRAEGRIWKGRHALMYPNSDIAVSFSNILIAASR
jgi:glycosyltransferase involved in cell wall biosynthesis